MNRRNFSASLITSAGLVACRGDNSFSLIGKSLPSIKGVYTDGRGFDLAQITKPAIIRFWGMWCGPCMIDMPNWLSVVRKLRSAERNLTDVSVFTVHVGLAPSNGKTLAQWVEDQEPDVATPVVDDATNAIMRAVGITGTPSTIYVNKLGKIEEHAWQFKNERGEESFLQKVRQLHAKDL
jgi:thiol-disulfide isomerase/thioredoxin